MRTLGLAKFTGHLDDAGEVELPKHPRIGEVGWLTEGDLRTPYPYTLVLSGFQMILKSGEFQLLDYKPIGEGEYL